MVIKRDFTLGSINACSGHWLIAATGIFKRKWAHEPSSYINNLRDNFKNMNFYKSVNDIHEYADIICGSPPCSGISVANPKRHLEHPANQHMIDFVKKCAEIEPRVVMMEESANLVKFEPLFNRIMKILTSTYTHVDYRLFNYGDILDIQDRHRILIVASDKEIDLDYLVKPSYKKIKWKDILRNIRFKTFYPFDIERMPYKSHRRKDFSSRVVNPRRRFFAVTGTSERDIVFLADEKPTYRFCSIEELEAIMGFPYNYKYHNDSISWKVGTIARGVPIRETQLILRRLKKCMISN